MFEGNAGTIFLVIMTVLLSFWIVAAVVYSLTILFSMGYDMYERWAQKRIDELESLPPMGVEIDETYLQEHWLFNGLEDGDDKRK